MAVARTLTRRAANWPRGRSQSALDQTDCRRRTVDGGGQLTLGDPELLTKLTKGARTGRFARQSDVLDGRIRWHGTSRVLRKLKGASRLNTWDLR